MKKISKISILILLLIVLLEVKSLAGTVSISSPSSVEPGQTFSISVTGNNATGRVNISASNATLTTSSVWIEDNTQTVQATAGGEGTISISANPVDVSDSESAEPITAGSSCSTSIVAPVVEQPPVQTQKPVTAKPAKTTKVEKKEEEKIVETKPPVQLYTLSITGITYDDEEVELNLDKEFESSNYEYYVEVENEIKYIKVTADSHDYNDFIKIVGDTEELVTGANSLTISINANDENVEYVINVNKKDKIIEEEPIEPVQKEFFLNKKITLSVWQMILIIIVTIAISIIISKFIFKNKNKRQK